MKTSNSIKISLLFAIMAFATLSANAYDWKKTLTLQGRGTRQSCVFPLVGEKWRINFTPKSKGNVKVELLDENGNAFATLLNLRNLDISKTSVGQIIHERQNVALRVEGSINGWSCSLEQYVDAGQGWELYKWNKDYDNGGKLERFAMWTGEAGDEVEIPVNVEAKTWRVFFETFESGKVKVELVDSQGRCHLLNYHLLKGTSDGWVFSPGEYTLKVTSIGSTWAVSFETDKDSSASKFVK